MNQYLENLPYELSLCSDDSEGSYGYCSDSVQLSPDSSNSQKPSIEIVEQPGDFRYRYEKEKYHGHILGISSPFTKKKDLCKFPSIKVHNYKNDVLIRCWLISSKLEKPTAHFHKLARKLPKGEMKLEPHDFFATERNNFVVTFDYLYIVHAVMNDPNDMKIYEQKRTWLESGSFHRPKYTDLSPPDKDELKHIERNQSVLYFEAYDAHTGEKLCEAVSRKIKNLHNPETAMLKIVNYSKTYGTCRGGDEVFVLVEKISKDVEVRFFELKGGSSERIWEARADFGPQNVHHQYAIVFRTPHYRDEHIKKDVQVYFELFRKTDSAFSEPVKFTFKPDEYCRMHDLPRKRPHSPDRFTVNNGNILLSQSAVKKSKEAMSPDSTTMYVPNPTESEEVLFENFLECYGATDIQIDPETLNWSQDQNASDIMIDLELQNYPDIQTLLANDKYSSDGVSVKKEMIADDEEELPRFQMAYPISKEDQNNLDEISSQEISSTDDIVDLSIGGMNTNKYKDMIYAIKTDDRIHRFEKILKKLDSDCINDVDFGGNSVFLIASGCSKEALRILLGHKDVNRSLKNLAGDNALLIAAKNQRLDLVEELLKNRFDPNGQNYKTGETALHIAVATENLALVQLLLQYGANPLIDNYGLFSSYDYSSNSENVIMKKVIYEKAQQFFMKQRQTTVPSPCSISEGDQLVKELQTLKVSTT
uniref:Relish n=1 Tax=Riptortus pedestris TaxID=329032 RepID=R4WQ18_RIPPE|nr:relish [Riptortus pedestris]BAN21001.1 relish-like transcription factor [Riptortus pedestris]